MTATSYGIIWNPSKIDGDVLRPSVEEHLAADAADADVRWWETTADDPGRGMALEAVEAGCTTVIAVGGDGTVRAVAEALAGTDVALGIVPQGTGNLLARNLEVPLDNVPAALRRINEGESRRIDLGWVRIDDDERAFAVMVGFGVDAQMLVETDDDLKARAGWLAYVEAMGRAMAGTEMTDITVALDDEEPRELRGHTMLIGNCGMVQGGLRLLPDAKLDDGLLDLLLVSADGAVQWLDTVRSVVWENGIRRLLTRGEKAVSTDSTRFHSAERVRVELASPLEFEVDGEEVGTVSSFEVRVQAGALRVL
ncbi:MULTISPECIES: diacylglycerol kinase family protein [unclassified Microbacterium]|uniref:diacylglycerol/lipid kinase family protein n=1 Tax=unclassified Microbacterium TaxID=2609290 RepID=UPI001D57DA32|nr:MULTISPECIES: diacylglycerol kinase family protein [unclassified Microbacterium]CAH0157821.1 Diacylglycerol kinase [Microbacterium sp. Bi121]HWK76236.1 diacylglycerol kinase family protein [Microbacterium sp.]